MPRILYKPTTIKASSFQLWFNFARQITKTTKPSSLLENLGWKNLTRQRQIQRATMVYKSLHGLVPEYLCSKFVSRDTTYSLRDSESKVTVPLPRTNYYKNSFSYSGAVLWNSLPCNVRQAESLIKFKQLIKSVF